MPASNNAERFFPTADAIVRSPLGELAAHESVQRANAAVVMTHSLQQDALALASLCDLTGLRYLGLLGPANRRDTVLAMAGLDAAQLPVSLAGPMGLNLGGDLPESVALSVLAECHAVLEGRDASSLSAAFSGASLLRLVE